jgi:hypothetical protein
MTETGWLMADDEWEMRGIAGNQLLITQYSVLKNPVRCLIYVDGRVKGITS